MNGRGSRLGLVVAVVCLSAGPAWATDGAAAAPVPAAGAVRLVYGGDEICLVDSAPPARASRRPAVSWRDPVVRVLAGAAPRRLARCSSRVGAIRCLGGG
ncbi:hypothetical protein [Phaeospirillum tilakii]|uniref:Uncharacterized protein n=1 Tax=Phaeospirillum tilakii TaxID=741673 RepID=A0ABW5C902_9PROT